MNNPFSATSAARFGTKFGRDVKARTINNKLIEAVLTSCEPRAKQLVEQVDSGGSQVSRHRAHTSVANAAVLARQVSALPVDNLSKMVVDPADSKPTEYALATGQAAVHRLRILDQVYGPGTRTLLQHCGLQRGMRVADIGCGVGMVTRLLADLVGPEGTAMGIDVSADQLEQARSLAKASGQKNLSFFQGDAVDTGLPHGSFDLVYCRFLLLHLRQPTAALRQMYSLLRPGGILVCEDGDLTSAGSIPASALNAFADLFGQLAPIRGVDYTLSRHLHRLALESGFAQPNIRIHQPAIAVGEGKSLLVLSVIEASPAFLDAGLLTLEELGSTVAEMRRATEDKNVLALMPPMTQVWATKIS